MSKLKCKCGFIINLVTVPSPDGYLLISEEKADEIELSIENEGNLSLVFDQLENSSSSVYLCPNCRGLLVFWCRNENRATYYKRDG